MFCLPAVAAGQYRFDIWTTDRGLPQNSVNGIFQSSDGFLWFTTNDGIVRFDGVRFKVFDKANTEGLLNNRFNFAFEDGRGRYWFRAEEEALVLYENGVFKTFNSKNGLPGKKIGPIFDDKRGGVNLEVNGDCYNYADGKFSLMEFKKMEPEKNGLAVCFADSKGGVWRSVNGGLRRYFENEEFEYDLNYGNNPGISIFEDRLGNFWFGSSGHQLVRIYQGRLQKFSLVPGNNVSFTEDVFGNIWMGHSKGVTRINSAAVESAEPRDDQLQTFTDKDGLTDNRIISIAADREGGVWAGSITGGLTQITRQSIKVFSGSDWNSPDENVYPILEDSENNVWLGVWVSSLVKYANGKFSTYQAPPNISSLLEDSNKRLWIGTLEGLYEFKNGRVENMNDEVGIPSTTVIQAIIEDRQNNLWLGTGADGLLRYKDGKIKGFTTDNGLPENKVTALLEMKDGRICVGTRQGLAFLKDDEFTVMTEKDGLTSNYVRSLYEDDEGILWIGTYDNGLSRYKDGKFFNYTVGDGLYSKNVFCILEDDNGWFWINSNTGIYRVSRRELEDFAAGKIEKITSIAYTTRDGLKNAEGNGERHPAGIKRKNGEMWFPTLQGAAVVNPAEIRINALPPPVHFDDILIDGKNIGNYRDQVTLKPEQENIEIDYTGLSFVNSNLVKFRYRMEGIDKDWNEAGTRRFAYYNHLPPGEYVFRLQAANRDGVWNREGKMLKVIVQPLFYETWWFFALVSLSVTGLVLLIFFYRISQLKQIAEAKTSFARQLIKSQEAERKRIAAELHDGLGQSLVIIKNRAILGVEEKDFGEFDEISNNASNALTEVREIIYNLRPQHLERIGLTRAIRAMLRRTKGIIDFHEEIETIDGLFSESVEIYIYRIVQECVNNIIKHSGATAAKVKVGRDGRKVLITVEDNGRGFDVEQVKEKQGGFGLLGLKERVRLLNGDFAIRSEFETGFGTTILIKLPIQTTEDN
ncbi:MAG: two-component regulator propeller domain-containing protein [Pyrinomonadaceae bacterium]